jgi:hypothetical protein
MYVPIVYLMLAATCQARTSNVSEPSARYSTGSSCHNADQANLLYYTLQYFMTHYQVAFRMLQARQNLMQCQYALGLITI